VGRWAGLVRLVGEEGRWGFDQLNAQLALLANDPSPQCLTLAQRIRNLSLEGLAGPYLELFARRRWPGWDAWGNEIECTVQFP
jgi:hypothetical protein